MKKEIFRIKKEDVADEMILEVFESEGLGCYSYEFANGISIDALIMYGHISWGLNGILNRKINRDTVLNLLQDCGAIRGLFRD